MSHGVAGGRWDRVDAGEAGERPLRIVCVLLGTMPSGHGTGYRADTGLIELRPRGALVDQVDDPLVDVAQHHRAAPTTAGRHSLTTPPKGPTGADTRSRADLRTRYACHRRARPKFNPPTPLTASTDRGLVRLRWIVSYAPFDLAGNL